MSSTDIKRQPPWRAPNVLDLPAEAGFTAWEHWAWARLLRGLRADMARYPGDKPAAAEDDLDALYTWIEGEDDGAGDDPSTADDWPEHRILSDAFLRVVLFHEPYVSAPEQPEFEFWGARIDDPLAWDGRQTRGDLIFSKCRFAKPWAWRGGHVRGTLNLQASHIAASDGALTFDRLRIDGGFFARDGFVCKGSIRSFGASIGGQAAFVDATLNGDLSAAGATIHDGLFLRDLTLTGQANLVAVKIGSHLQLLGSTIDGEINLTGATVDGELHLEQTDPNTRPKWRPGASLILRNVNAGALAGSVDAFKIATDDGAHGDFIAMDLAGFRYDRIGGLGAKDGATLAQAKVEDLKAWLRAGSHPETYTPEPYRQLAHALDAAGYPGKAKRILHAMRRYQCDCETGRRKLWLSLQGRLIGFGYHNNYAIRWFLAFGAIAMGAGLVLTGHRFDPSPAGIAEFFQWVWFTIGNGLPLILLDKAHETFLAAQVFPNEPNPDPQKVPVGLASLFYVQKILGFVVLTYLAAGLSGLASREPAAK
ncbi:MAG: hypothetical protein ACFB2Z_15240 [Maricaulaceae bacterium]